MKRYWNNKGRIIFSVVFVVFCSMLLALCFILPDNAVPDNADSGPYLDSAHGKSYGVNRSSLSTFGYAIGNCAHCHEQHASIGGSEPTPNSPVGPDQFLLFSDNYTSQTDSFCLKCHVNTGSVQTGGAITNHSYSFRAGGLTPDFLSPADIVTAFSYCYSGCSTPSSSSHNLGDIRTFITGKWNYTADSNPCNACHSPHMAEGDPANLSSGTKSSGARGWPVSLPSLHSKDNNAWGLWGDDPASERMSIYAPGKYQAPKNSASTYEPDGSLTQDGSNLTDFDTFCIDCHDNANNITTSHGSLPNRVTPGQINKFNWAGEHHGSSPKTTYCGLGGPPPTVSLLAAPYDGLNKCGQYVLACTDCHEPHGSPNNFLVRKQVNNGTVTVTQYGAGNGPDGKANKEWVYLCGRCHTNLNTGDLHSHPQDYNGDGTDDCAACHPSGGTYRNCQLCHYHGNTFTHTTRGTVPLF